jgi:outer membrane protein W
MLRKALVGMLFVLAVTSPGWAQTPRGDFSVLFGYTLADGVSGDPFRAPDGATYDRVDPKDSVMFGIAAGYYVTPGWEIGFMWRQQPTTIEVSGTRTTELGDSKINGYHGFFAYHFGEPEAGVRPYLLFGLGATHYGGFSIQTPSGATETAGSETQFSTTWGAGVKAYASPNVGFQAGVQWTPTYIKSDPGGYWCGWYGCYVVGDAQYANQFEFVGGITVRF